MKLHTSVLLLALCVPAVAPADEPIGFERAMKLVTKYNCQSCHSVDKTLAGPSFHDIAKRYASDPHAQVELSERIVNGTLGAWGPNVMPPTKVPDQDLKPLVEWILSLREY
jgi:cytochrome c